jgi:protein SCO1/2
MRITDSTRATTSRAPILLLALASLAVGCTRQRVASQADATAARATAVASGADAASDAPTGDSFSVYDLGSTWRDQTGAERAIASLAGRPRVVTMMYTHCEAVCPLTVAAMRRIEREAGPNVGLVLVSLDPERDTAARLAEFAAEHGLAPERWTLLAGSDADVRDLAATLGVRYARVSGDELAHANALTLLDARGTIVRRQSGSGAADADEIIRAVRALGS